MSDPHMPGAWVGYEPRDGVIWQGAKPHGPMTVGRGGGRFSAVGCVACAVTEALRYLGVNPKATPLDVQAAGLKRPGVWAQGSSGANIPELVRAQGLTVGVDRDGPGSSLRADELRPVILDCLAKGGVVLCGIDMGGTPVTDHWALAYGHDGVRLHMADPATADHESVDLRTLTGQAVWAGVPRAYRVARVITVFR